ncbi:MAG TPA: Gfo/Idh/MocA family oxidoreductase [Hyphomicrobiaceae bacterium]|mgnify:CR=1 FL=1|nr:Gfo/Idh/MocA family oxidoreductase [Hyphomicrobiaceae bacterium]
MSGHGLAIVGLGLAVEPHARALDDIGDRVDVRWAFSRSQERRDAFNSKFPWRTTGRLDDIFEDPDVKSILLLTPPASHIELAGRAAAHGKHILIEKPLALTSREAAAIVDTAKAAGVTLGVVLQHRHKPNAVRLGQILRAGALGSVEAASATIPWWRPQSYYDEPGRGTMARDGGGVLMTQAIHTLDLFRSLIGPVTKVAGLARTTALHRMETEDFAAALFVTASGAVATLTATTAAYPGSAETIRLVCSKGTAVLDGNALTVSYLSGSEEKIVSDAGTGSGADPMAFSAGPHKSLIEDFLDAVEQKRSPIVTGADALATQRLIDAILSSSALRSWVEVPA